MKSPPKKSLFIRFFIWRNKNLNERQFILIVAVLVGFVAGLGSLSLKAATFLIQRLLENSLVKDYRSEFYFVFPMIGLGITFLIIKYIIRHKIGHGIPRTLLSISKNKGILKGYQMFASLLTAPFTVGFGGSVGLEGPAVSTGAAIGSNLGRLFHLNQRQRTLLISCAAAGALSAILKAPITAIVFAIEVFSLDLTLSSMLPLLLASVTGIITSQFLYGPGFLLPFEATEKFSVDKTPFYIVLGVISGLMSLYCITVYDKTHALFDKIKNPVKRIFIAGALIGLIVYFFPPLYGEGYHTINDIINGHTGNMISAEKIGVLGNNLEVSMLIFLIGMLVLKIIAASLTFGGGGIGGIFAPTLFMGSLIGLCVSRGINMSHLFDIKLSENNFALVGMAGLLSGVLHAPLTAIFLIAEVTGGYDLFIPLMLTSAVSFAISKGVFKHSIYTMELGRKGELITHDKDSSVLILMELDRVLETNFIKIYPEMTLGELVHEAVVKSNRNIFPVVEQETDEFLGVVLLDDIRTIMFDAELYQTVLVKDTMHAAPETIDLKNDRMADIMKKFEDSSAWNLPVVEGGKYLGFISKSKLLTVYRRKLIQVTQ